MTGYTPQYRYIKVESERLANADLSERDRHSDEDHSAHAAGKICKSCGRTIEAGQPARHYGLIRSSRGLLIVQAETGRSACMPNV
jgi:hypothetical protein